MSLRSQAQPGSGEPEQSHAYRESFLRDVYHLIWQGHLRLKPAALPKEEEPAITGMLTVVIEQFLDDPDAPRWTEFYCIQDERHISGVETQGKKLKGKSRPRVDLEVVCTQRRPRQRFQIEAKRLRENDSKCISAYLGKEGLGCFLSGRYASGHLDAGMLGYVQSGDPADWAAKIGKKQPLRHRPLLEEMKHTYRSTHPRPTGPKIEIHHIFLLCHAGTFMI